MTDTQRSLSPAVNRAATILEILAEEDCPLGTSEIARRINAPKSTSSNILGALAQSELIERVGNDYVLGEKLIGLAAAQVTRAQLIARFEAVSAVHASDSTVVLAELDGTEIAILACHSGTSPVGVSTHQDAQGRDRLAAVASAPGLALLAELDTDELDEAFQDLDLPRLTSRSHQSLDDVCEALERTRERGYAIDSGLHTSDVVCFARTLPVTTSGQRCAVGIRMDKPAALANSDLGIVIRTQLDNVVNSLTPYLAFPE